MKYDLVPFRLLASEYELNAAVLFQYAHAMYTDAVNRDGLQYEIEELRHDLDADLSFSAFDDADDRLILRIQSSGRYSREFFTRFEESYQCILREMMKKEQLKRSILSSQR